MGATLSSHNLIIDINLKDFHVVQCPDRSSSPTHNSPVGKLDFLPTIAANIWWSHSTKLYPENAFAKSDFRNLKLVLLQWDIFFK